MSFFSAYRKDVDGTFPEGTIRNFRKKWETPWFWKPPALPSPPKSINLNPIHDPDICRHFWQPDVVLSTQALQLGHPWPQTGVKERPLPRKLRKKKPEKGFPGLSVRGQKSWKKSRKIVIFQVFLRVFGSGKRRDLPAAFWVHLPHFFA